MILFMNMLAYPLSSMHLIEEESRGIGKSILTVRILLSKARPRFDYGTGGKDFYLVRGLMHQNDTFGLTSLGVLAIISSAFSTAPFVS
ncbi:hypothetical protein V6N13_090764 [Hibiscus sabdariffa]